MKAEILSYLSPDHPWRRHIHWMNSTESTNTLAKTLAAEGAPHGTVVIADRQTGGRGRLGRSFFSPAGKGIYMSLILRPQYPPHKLMHLTCAAAVAACDAITGVTQLRPGIKWTNDLILNDKKLGGILTELSFSPGNENSYAAIIGIGINCSQELEDFDPSIRHIATSLSIAGWEDISRARLCAAMVQALQEMDTSLLEYKADIVSRYRQDCITIGKDVCVIRGDEVRHGHAVDIDDAGALVVSFSDGHTETVNSGEVSVRGLYGYV